MKIVESCHCRCTVYKSGQSKLASSYVAASQIALRFNKVEIINSLLNRAVSELAHCNIHIYVQYVCGGRQRASEYRKIRQLCIVKSAKLFRGNIDQSVLNHSVVH
jgi:hypothetical protein